MNNRAGISERHFNLSLATDASPFHLRGGIVEMKRCSKCKRYLPINQFNAASKEKDGLKYHCKHCDKAYRKANRSRISAYDRKYYIMHKEAKAKASRDRREKKRDFLNAQKRKYAKDNPEKIKAQRAITRAIKSGEISRPEICEICGKSCKPDAHHPDYNKPLEVSWLCRGCHHDVHYFIAGKGE